MRALLLAVILPALVLAASLGAAGDPPPDGGRVRPPAPAPRAVPPADGPGPKRAGPGPLTLDPWDYLLWPRETLTAEDGRVKKAVNLKDVIAAKYDGHSLRFSGRLTRFDEDTGRNVYRFTLVGECVEGRGELDPVRHDTLPLLFYLAENSRPLRDEVAQAAADGATLHLTVESEAWAYHDALPGYGSAYTGLICEQTKIVGRRREEGRAKVGATVPPTTPAEAESAGTAAARSFGRLVERLPGLLAKAQFPPVAGAAKGAGRFTRLNAARMVGPDEAKLDLSVVVRRAEDGSESVVARCALYLAYTNGRWAVTRREGTRNFVQPDGSHRDELVMLVLELEEWTGEKPVAPR